MKLATKYLFSRYGGGAVTKGDLAELFGRFGVDLDFTYLRQEGWEGLSKSERGGSWYRRPRWLAQLIENSSRDLGLKFAADVRNGRFVEFGSGSRLVTYKLYRHGELLKVQVNLVETLLFKP